MLLGCCWDVVGIMLGCCWDVQILEISGQKKICLGRCDVEL